MRSEFQYRRPASIDEAVAMKADLGTTAMYWAGGTDMVLHWMRSIHSPELCIDITRIEGLRGIEIDRDSIRIGAMTSLDELDRSADRHCLLNTLSDITKLMCTPQTRTIATVGGNLCNASPAADLSPAFVAMNADAMLAGPKGRRRVRMEDFFLGVNKTSLSGGELLEEIRIPLNPDRKVVASYRRIDRTVVDIALVNASSCISVDSDGVINGCGIALGAVAPVILRVSEAETLLLGLSVRELGRDREELQKVEELSAIAAKPISDVRASAEYRRQMVKVMVRRTLQDCAIQLKA